MALICNAIHRNTQDSYKPDGFRELCCIFRGKGTDRGYGKGDRMNQTETNEDLTHAIL